MPNEIFIIDEVYRRMFAYAEIAKKKFDSEVGGLLVIAEQPEGGLIVEDIILPEQTVGGGSFKAKPGIKLTAEQIPKIHGWWHSHHTMGAFHSSEDDDTLGNKWNGETSNSARYAVSIVVALPNKMQAYMQYFKPILTTKIDVPISILRPPTDALYEKCNSEVEEKVKKEFFQSNCWQKGWDWDASLQKWVPPKEEVRSELPEPKEKVDEAVEKITGEDWDGTDEDWEEIITLQAEDCVIDPTTGYSVTILKELGMWNLKYDADLENQVKQKKEILRGEKPKHLLGKRLQYGQCPHISINGKGRPICFFKGRNYNCKDCERLPKSEKSEKKEENLAKTEKVDAPSS